MTESRAVETLGRLSAKYGQDPLLVQGAGGNTSVKTSDGQMIVKASGFALKTVTGDQGWVTLPFAKVSKLLDGQSTAAKLDPKLDDSLAAAIDGMTSSPTAGVKASIEAAMHAVLDDVVVHIHPVEINTVLCAEGAEELCKKVFADVPFIWISAMPPGYYLAKVIKERILTTKPRAPAVIFMASHGVIVHGRSESEVNRVYDDILSLARKWIVSKAGSPAIFSVDGWQNEISEKDIFPDTVVFHELAKNLETASASKKQGIIETFAASRIIRHLHRVMGLNSAPLPVEICDYILGMSREKHRQKEATK
jgi:rhamnose utilization protein RhaD (predicted bifunctional aldolase and dehydrogenase)